MDTTTVKAPVHGATFRLASPPPFALVSILIVAAVSFALAACGGGGGGAPAPAPTYSVNATVSGLAGTGLSLSLNGGTAISISADGVVALGSNLADGAQYSVAVSASPQDPSQTCALDNASGTIHGSSASISVTCSTNASQPAVKAAIDASLPSALTQMIAQVQTVGGSGPLGAWINSGATNADGETLVLALDAAGHPVAAAMTTSFDGTLSADSTALSLVRLLIADVSTTMTAAQINTTIRASSQYPALVAAINTDLQASSLPLSDVSVVNALTAVASAAAAITATPAASIAKGKAAIAVGPWTSGNKLTIVSGDLIYLLAAGGSHTAALVNGLPIPWSVTESTAAGIVEGPTTLPKGSLNSLAAPVDLAVQMSNATFTLNLQQSPSTLASIAGDFEVALLKGFSSVVTKSLQLPASCVNIVPSALQSAVAKAANSSTLQDPLSLAKGAVNQSVLQSVYGQCGSSVTVSLGTAAMYASIEQLWVDYASKMSGINGVLSVELSALNLVGEAVAGEIYWQKTYSVEVCTASDWTVHSCVATLSIINPTLYMAPGTSSTTGSVVAKASDGTLTVLPGDLNADPSSNPSVLSVSQTAGQITATTADVLPPDGAINVTVSDPATGIVSAVDSIFVVLPTLYTSQRTLNPPGISTDITVKFLDPMGHAIQVPDNISWATTATSGQFVFKSSSAGQSIWTIPAGASPPGSFDVTATDPAGIVYPPLTLTLGTDTPLTVYEFVNPQSQVGNGIDILTPVPIPITGSTFTSSCVGNLSPPCSSNTSPINQTPGTQKGASAGYSGTQIGTVVNGTALYNPHVCSVGKKWVARPTYTWQVIENDGLPNAAGCTGAGFIRTRSGTVDLNASGDLTITLLWDDANHWTCPNTTQYSETVATDNHFTSSYTVNLNTGAGSYSETTVYPFRDDITALVANLSGSYSETDTNDGGSANWPAGTSLDNVGLRVVRTILSTDPVPAECTTP